MIMMICPLPVDVGGVTILAAFLVRKPFSWDVGFAALRPTSIRGPLSPQPQTPNPKP